MQMQRRERLEVSDGNEKAHREPGLSLWKARFSPARPGGPWVCPALVLRLAGGDERDIPRLRGQVGQRHLRGSRAAHAGAVRGAVDPSRGRPADRRPSGAAGSQGEVGVSIAQYRLPPRLVFLITSKLLTSRWAEPTMATGSGALRSRRYTSRQDPRPSS